MALLLLVFSAFTAVQIAKDPSDHLKGLGSNLNVTYIGASASFRWSSQGYNVTLTDTSTDNGSSITSWSWLFGDGTTFAGRSPPTHLFNTTCSMCTEPILLNVTDLAGHRSSAEANVTLVKGGSSSGAGKAPSILSKVPKIGAAASQIPAGIELVALLLLIAGSMAQAGWRLLRRELETVAVPVRPRPPGD